MDVAEICPLTEETILNLLKSRGAFAHMHTGSGRRQAERWPFPGTIELWIPDELGFHRHALGTCLDMSLDGAGVRCDDSLPVGLELDIAIHQPEASFHGRALVRHCTSTARGDHMVGLEFLLD